MTDKIKSRPKIINGLTRERQRSSIMIIPCLMLSTRRCLTFGSESYEFSSLPVPFATRKRHVPFAHRPRYWIQGCEARQYPGLLVTFALNAKGRGGEGGADAMCVSRCERVSWIMSCCESRFARVGRCRNRHQSRIRRGPDVARHISTARVKKKKSKKRTRLHSSHAFVR